MPRTDKPLIASPNGQAASAAPPLVLATGATLSLAVEPAALEQLVRRVAQELLAQLPPTPAAQAAPLLVSLREGARLLSCSERTLWGLVDAGEIQCVRIGTRLLLDPRDLQAWIDRAKGNGAEQTAPAGSGARGCPAVGARAHRRS